MTQLSATPSIILENVSFGYDDRPILSNLNFEFNAGEIVSILGPSGGGKSTFLKLIAGDCIPTQGKISRISEYAYVAQNYALFPHMSALKNIEIVLRRNEKFGVRFYQNLNATKTAKILLNLVGLSKQSNLLPAQLSGGQRQRIAIAQAMAMNAGVLLMDEPFGALDITTRQQLQDLLLSLVKKENLIAILVTHDLEEALYCSDRILLIRDDLEKLHELEKFQVLGNGTTRTEQLKSSDVFLKNLAQLHKATFDDSKTNSQDIEHILDLGIISEVNLVALENMAESTYVISTDLFQERNNKIIKDAVELNWLSGKHYTYILPDNATKAVKFTQQNVDKFENVNLKTMDKSDHWLFTLGETVVYKFPNASYRGYSYLGEVGATSLFRLPVNLVEKILSEFDSE